jgi:O-antigen ligase
LSAFVTTGQIQAVVGGLRRQQVMDIVRGAAFVGTLLLAWVSLRPFEDLSNMQIGDAGTGNELPTYATYGGIAALTIGLAMRDNMRALATLLSPAFVLFGGCVIGVTATLMLLPKSQNELMRWFSIAALGLLAVCYLGILLVPHLSIHQITDAQEPLLAGNWRGSFGHKNEAAAVMAMLLFLGIYVAGSGAWLSGAAIVGLASLFLLYSAGKSSLALCFVVLLLTSLTTVVRSFWLRAVMLLGPLLVLNMLSVGTVMSDSLAEIAKALPLDTSFTGRTDIWAFAVQALQERLPTGYGFQSFWGTSAIQGLPEGKEWAAFASHSHNGYLDAALGMGLPGLALLLVVLAVEPLRNFHRADLGGNNGPLMMALLRIWLFGLYLSSMESFFLDRASPLWFTFLLAVFGLHYLARFRVRE